MVLLCSQSNKKTTWSDTGSLNISLDGLSSASRFQKTAQPSMNQLTTGQQPQPQMGMLFISILSSVFYYFITQFKYREINRGKSFTSPLTPGIAIQYTEVRLWRSAILFLTITESCTVTSAVSVMCCNL